MKNYILADYKRIVSHIPRILLIAVYELIFFAVVIVKWSKAGDSYNSVSLMGHASTFIYSLAAITIGLVDFLSSFAYDFQSRTIQVAIGVGISRLKVIISKLIQIALLVLTDLLLTCSVLTLLCIITGIQLAPQQILLVFVNCANALLTTCCSASLVFFLVFRLQSLLLPMVAYFLVALGSIAGLLRWLSRNGPAILARLHLENYTFENCLEQLRTHILMGSFDLVSFCGIFAIMALGVYICWLFFRKLELQL